MLVIGVDGWTNGWVAVVLRDGRFADGFCAATLEGVAERCPSAQVIGVDIPIGLPERGVRRADRLAKRRLRERASTVFLTPPRLALEAPGFSEAREACGRCGAPCLSQQAWGLRHRIFEAESLSLPFVEVHPEISFSELAGEPLPSKKTWASMVARRSVLDGAGIVIPDDYAFPGAASDDVLDAAAVAWSADRVARNAAATLPEEPEPGEPRIWF